MGWLSALLPAETSSAIFEVIDAHAKALPADASKRSLLLIHDDADNCQPDLCALAGELRAGGIRTHVISLAPKPEDLAKMTCLPEITGGRLFLAQNAEQAEAAIEDALRLASTAAPGPSESARPPPPKAKEESPVALPIPSDGRPGLHLRTLLAEGNEPVAWPMHWSVTRIGQSGPPAFEGRAANPYVALAAGQYRIDARDGPMAVTQTVEVVDKAPTVADVVLNAGTLRVRAQWQKSGAPIGNGVISIADGTNPNVLREVRVRCAASAKPEECAADESVCPAINKSHTCRKRRQRMYGRSAIPVCSTKR